MEAMRLDRFLTETAAVSSRKLAKEAIKKGQVTVNDVICKKDDTKVTEEDIVTCYGVEYQLLGLVYYLYNKPDGEISATEDKKERTVMDAFPPEVRRSAFPVGRLDKDTEGLLIITNDGDLNHRLMSPKKHVDKTYEALVSGVVSEEGVKRLETGITFEEFTSLPAKFSCLKVNQEENTSLCLLTISEGKFHQVKRMFAAVGNDVLKLRRIAIGKMQLPEDLKLGEYRKVTRDEIMDAVFCG